MLAHQFEKRNARFGPFKTLKDLTFRAPELPLGLILKGPEVHHAVVALT
jgi:hypothetical protein